MKRTLKLIHQLDSMDCGAACLCMIAQYYGKHIPLTTMRNKTHLTRQGVSLFGLCEAAESIGLRTSALKLGINHLNQVPLPCILHWNQNHFVVLFEVQGKKGRYRYAVADPEKGIQQYNNQQLEHDWVSTHQNETNLGICLLLETTPAFYTTEDETIASNQTVFLRSYLKPFKKWGGQLLMGLLSGSLLQLILPFLTQSIVDFGINENNLSFIHLILIAQLVLIIGSTSVEFIRGWILLHMGTRINISLIADFLCKLMKLPMSYFDSKLTGDLLQRINDHNRIESFLTNSSLNTLFSMVTIIVFGIVLLAYNWIIFLVFFLGSILYFFWVTLFLKRRKKLDFIYFDKQAKNQSKLIQLVTGIQEIKLHGCENQKRWEWEHIQAGLFNVRVKALALRQYQDSGAVLINQSKNILVTALSAGLVLNGEMTLGMMLSVQYIIGQLNAPIDQLIEFIRSCQDAKISLDRLTEIHSQQEEDIESENKRPFSSIQQSIQLNQLTFTYDGIKPVLENICLNIPEGKQTAIVGMSGSGKTTLIKLLLGYYTTFDGDIRINNTGLHNYRLKDWRKHCGIVMQDGLIFSDSIAGNIAPGDEKIDIQRIRQAAETANIHQFINSLPLSYNTRIGAEGMNLSQGQKQRILIARAVYKNPDVLFMDEATNALDANNERCIMENLQAFFNGRTVIIVAHRLSTVRNADQIIVLHQGKIAEMGKHQELVDHRGPYFQLVKNQLEL